MENCVSMIALHYVCDKEDTPMWAEQKTKEKPQLLKQLLDLWKMKTPENHDIQTIGFELFHAPHFWHVAQGQGVLSKEAASIQLDAHGSRPSSIDHLNNLASHQISLREVDHAEQLKKTRDPISES